MKGQPVEEFFDALRESLSGGAFVRLTLGKYRGDDPTLKNVYARRVQIKGEDNLSLTFRHHTQDLVRNSTTDEALAIVAALLGHDFLSGHLFTTGFDLQLDFNRKREPRLTRSRATFDTPPAAEHDRVKQRFVNAEGNVYLRALGVTDAEGRVRAGAGDKFKQINKFVETVAHLLESAGLKGKQDLTLVDMGAGKGYLTFAVYDYLRNTLGLQRASVVGVEARKELVELCNGVAREAGFEGLEFRQGLIRDYALGPVDVLVALHACDTATDEALHAGLAAGAAVLITAPCCHKELRPQIETPEVLGGMLRHGIMLERQAEMLTDTLRALLLEASGYQTRVFEFVTTEHTRKNTMIAAVRAGGKTDADAALRQFRELKEFYGVREQRLEKLLCAAGDS
ncbi:MAG TPA: SAM-dependent methyltransferase [Pyrinomonadaceae bacterium]